MSGMATTNEPAQNGTEAFISELTGAQGGERPFVSVVVRYAGKEARLQIESDAGLIEQTATRGSSEGVGRADGCA